MRSADKVQLRIENSAMRPRSTSWPEWRIALWLALTLRFTYSGLGAFFGRYLPVNWELIHSNALTESLPAPNHSAHYLLLDIWQRFDTLWYLHIARYGYDRPDAVVFYPLYPGLIKFAAVFLQPLAAALLISTLGAFFFFWAFQLLLRPDINRDNLLKSLLWYALWPGSFIFFAAYPEAVLLAFILWSLYFARKEKWFAAVMLAIAAELTKAIGAIVVIPLLVRAIRRRSWSALWVLLTTFGAFAFPAWLQWSGHGTISAAYEHYWRTTTAAPWTTLWLALNALVRQPNTLLAFNLIFLVVICLLVGLSRVRLEYKLFAIGAVLLLVCKQTVPPLQSMMRYLLVVFPAFIGLSQAVDKPRQRIRFVLLAGMFVVNLALMSQFLGWSLVL